MEDLSEDELIEKIIVAALEDLADWRPPEAIESVGPAFPEVYTAFADRLKNLRRDIATELRGYALDDLKATFPDSQTPSRNPLFNEEGEHGYLASRLAKAKDIIPPDFVGGWSVKGKEIDLSYWRGVASYSVDQATLLSVGRDPRKTDYHALFRCDIRYDEAEALLVFLEDRHNAIVSVFGVHSDDSEKWIDSANFLVFRI